MGRPSSPHSFLKSSRACCGLPSVCFEGTGFCDVINHKINGYVAKKENENDLIEGINWCLNNWTNELAKKNINILYDKFNYNVVG